MSQFKTMRALVAVWCGMMLMASAAFAADPGDVGYQVCTSYFESNQSGLKGNDSYLAFTSRAEFDKVFGAAALMGQNSFLPDDAFESKVVVAVIKRGSKISKYEVQGVKVVNGALNVLYKTIAQGADDANFASPLILAVNGNGFNSVVFIENGKTAGNAKVAGAATSTSALVAQGRALHDAHKDKEAISVLQQAIKLNSKDSEAFYWLGLAHYRLSEQDKSLAALQESVRLRPSFGAYRNMGVILAGMGRWEEAEAASKAAILIDPNELTAYGDLADNYSSTGRDLEASSISQKAIRIAPKPYVIDYLIRGHAYRLLGLSEAALADFQQANLIDPQNNDVRDELAFGSLTAGLGDDAASWAAQSLADRSGQSVYALYPTFVGYFGSRMAGKNEAAAKFLKEAEVKGDAKVWPFPVVRYLRGELSDTELLALATDKNKLTEANAYIGLRLALDGQPEKAMPFLRWVEQNGVRSYSETALAKAQIARIEQTAAK